jgi:Tol biopolymer transport system component
MFQEHEMKNNIFTISLLVLLTLAGCRPAKPVVTPTATPLPPISTSTSLPIQSPTPASTPIPLPSLSSSGGGVLAFASLKGNDWQIHIMNADGSEQKQVTVGVRGGYEPTWSPDGAKIVFQYGGLWIADIVSGELSRIPLSVKDNNLPNEYLVKPSWSADGEWIAFLNESGTQGDIYLIRPDGTDLRRLTDSNNISRDGDLVWSPDGKQLAYSVYRDETIVEIYVMDVEDALQGVAVSQQLTDSPAFTWNLVTSWSPDGSRLAFSSDRDGNTEIYLMNVDGSNVVRLTNNLASDTQPDWSPDGKQIAFTSDRDGNTEIYVLDVEEAILSTGDANVKRLTNYRGDEAGPVWKPAIIASASSAGLALDVPQGARPTLDGVFSPGEWDSALRQETTNGGEILMIKNDDFLYMGFYGNFDGVMVTSVCLEYNNRVSILHSSASLGTAIFDIKDNIWQLIQPFTWELYGVTSNTARAEGQRQAFFTANGWLANLGTMSETEQTEYQIAIPQGTFHLAAAYLLPPDGEQVAWWPSGLADDCRKIELLQGNSGKSMNPPLLLQFAPETWATITIP